MLRPRTRSQWNEYYRNLYKMNRKKNEKNAGSIGEGGGKGFRKGTGSEGDDTVASVGTRVSTGEWTEDDSDVQYLGDGVGKEVVSESRSDSSDRDDRDMWHNPVVISEDSEDSDSNANGSTESDDLSLSLSFSESESTEMVEEVEKAEVEKTEKLEKVEEEEEEDEEDGFSDKDYEEADEPLFSSDDFEESSSDDQETGGHKKTRADKIKKDEVVVINKNEFLDICKDARLDRKKVGPLAGTRSKIYNLSTNIDSVGKANKSGGGTDHSRIHNAREEVHDDVNERGSKRRKAFGNFCSPVSGNDEFVHEGNSDSHCGEQEKFSMKKVKFGKKNTRGGYNDSLMILLDALDKRKEGQCPVQGNEKSLDQKFRFKDEDEAQAQAPPAKSEWEMEIDRLFYWLHALEVDVVEDDDYQDFTKFDESPTGCCCRGEHILDEQIGTICEYCGALKLDIKYVIADFRTAPSRRRGRDRVDSDISPDSINSQIQEQNSAAGGPDSINDVQGTVWNLIPGVEKELYPHQRQAFEFMWKNLAGDIQMEILKQQTLSDDGIGCIISHAMGTGKTRLTIMFLKTFLTIYTTCRVVIIAPPVMLLAWEAEFIKWDVKIPIHNLSKDELSSDEALAADIDGQASGRARSRDDIRLHKLASWVKGGSILGMSYQLFQTLAGENGKGQNQHFREIIRTTLLNEPDLLVLDEGHTARNNESQIWNALMQIRTPRRIILSGTLYQNNLKELHNTLCLVNPKSVNQHGDKNDSRGPKGRASKKWMELTSSIGKSEDDRVLKLKRMLEPFIHVHQGEILEERLPGLSECLVFLHPTELQKAMLETASKANPFVRSHLVSLISVHPSLKMDTTRYSPMHEHELKDIKSDVDAGVKAKFIMKLIWLADALKERVLIFSQYLSPLDFLKHQMISRLSWTEGREVLYMDGKFNEKRRQELILSFNDEKSEAKVLLASEKACSEGISLVGASRVVLIDTVWNPSVEKQAISRAYRLGQKKVVYVYRLFTSGTEVRQYALQVDKKRISEMIVCPVDGVNHQRGKSREIPEDQILEAMRNSENLHHIFEDVICQPTESDLIKVFGLMDQK